jgi:hypothetical protein
MKDRPFFAVQAGGNTQQDKIKYLLNKLGSKSKEKYLPESLTSSEF